MKKVTIITDVAFWNQAAGHQARIANLVIFLAEKTDLTIVYALPYHPDDDTEEAIEEKFNIKLVYLEKFILLSNEDYGARLKDYASTNEIDCCIIEYIHNSYFLKYLDRSVKRILDMHDIVSERTESFNRFGFANPRYDMAPDVERKILNIYDYILPICEPDYHRLIDYIPKEKVISVPHSATARKCQIRETVQVIGFIASPYQPNQDAIMTFIEKCWLEISEKFPVHLNIYGTITYSLQIDNSKYKNINLRGYQPDLQAIYDEIDIAINPVRFGAGLKIKNLEAMANSKPLITTTHGARGLEKGIGNAFIVANDKESFVSGLEKLVLNYDYRKQLADNAMAYINENFSPSQCYDPLLRAINNS